MALGRTPTQPGLLSSTVDFCADRLAPNSIYAVLHRECRSLFPDEMFSDLFAGEGRDSIPPMIVAVATQDTITLIRSAVRQLLRAAGHELRAVIYSGDAYTDTRKPVIDWTDAAEREALVDSRARDAYALLAVLDGQQLAVEVDQAARLLACVVGQDLLEGEDGVLRIARRVAKDRVISTVDPEARHGHKTAARGFDG